MLVLAWALAKRNVLELRRYPLQLVALVFVMWSMFAVIFFGMKAVGGSRFMSGDSPSALAIGFAIFFLMQQSYQELNTQLLNETMQGTLEQLAMSKVGLLVTLCLEFVANALLYLAMMMIALVAMMATTGQWLHMDVLSLIPLFALTISSMFGLGLALAGFSVVFKRIGVLTQLIQFGFLGVLVAPVDRLPLLKALPVSLGYRLIQQVMVKGHSIFELAPRDLGLLVLNAAAYLAFGVVVFRAMDRKARELGLLGQY